MDTPSRQISVTDRATMNNIIQHTDAYNIGTDCLYRDIISPELISLPLAEEHATRFSIGWIARRGQVLPDPLSTYIQLMKKHMEQCYFGKEVLE